MIADPRIDLSHGRNKELFEDRLNICERSIHSLNDYDSQFVTDLARLYRNRSDNDEVGFTWHPTVRHWNYLINVWEKVR